METFTYLPISDITPNPYQPRKQFDEEQLKELAQSISENGVIQPIIVRKSAVIGYELLAGERRLRACQLAGLETIPVVVKELSDEELLYQSIIENLQRADLTPIEEAKSYQNLVQKGLTHEDIARIMGKSRPYITNVLRLLNGSKRLIKAVEAKEISQGHARLLISYSEEKQDYWIDQILAKDWSVRTLENYLSKETRTKQEKQDIFIQEEEKKLQKIFGTPVRIYQKKDGKGSINITFSNLEEAQRIIHILDDTL